MLLAWGSTSIMCIFAVVLRICVSESHSNESFRSSLPLLLPFRLHASNSRIELVNPLNNNKQQHICLFHLFFCLFFRVLTFALRLEMLWTWKKKRCNLAANYGKLRKLTLCVYACEFFFLNVCHVVGRIDTHEALFRIQSSNFQVWRQQRLITRTAMRLFIPT